MVLVRVEQDKDGYLRLKLVDPTVKMESGKDVVYDLCLTDDPSLGQIKSDVDTAREDIGVIEHYFHSRWRVYPQDVTASILLAAAAVADTFGAWTQVIPLNTIPFDYQIVGFCMCAVSAATSYHIQFGYNTVNAVPSPNHELGERSLRIVTVPIARATELLDIRSQEIPANGMVWARMKTASGAADTANITVVLTRHIDVSREVPLWPAFPW